MGTEPSPLDDARDKIQMPPAERTAQSSCDEEEIVGSATRTRNQASSLDASIRGAEGDKKSLAAKVGALVAERAKAAGVSKVVFDRGGNRYAGRIASLADAAREAGLEF